MHGRTSRWLAGFLTAALLGAAAGVQGQEASPSFSVASPFSVATEQTSVATGGQFISNSTMENADDLAARFSQLEADVKKMKDQGEAAKKKAASQATVEVHGRVLVDGATFSQDALNKQTYGDMTNGVGFRSVRLGAAGRMCEVFEYKVEVDFASGIYDNDGTKPLIGDGVSYKDVYGGITDLPWIGNVRVGHFKEPFCLDELNQDLYVPFLERNMGDASFVPNRNLGVMAFNWTENRRATWAIGAFQNDAPDTLPRRDDDHLSVATTMRGTWLPWYDEATDSRGLFHLGAAYSYRDGYDSIHAFRAKPETVFGGNAAYIVNGGSPALIDYQLLGMEAAFVYGPTYIQTEYMQAILCPVNGALPQQNIYSYYVQLGWFLTGENRTYDRNQGAFGKVVPYENFFRVRTEDGCVQTGRGAWELVYRYDYLNEYEMGPTAGLASTHTLGVNWYLCQYSRLMWDWVHATPSKNQTAAGNVDVLMMRCQVNF